MCEAKTLRQITSASHRKDVGENWKSWRSSMETFIFLSRLRQAKEANLQQQKETLKCKKETKNQRLNRLIGGLNHRKGKAWSKLASNSSLESDQWRLGFTSEIRGKLFQGTSQRPKRRDQIAEENDTWRKAWGCDSGAELRRTPIELALGEKWATWTHRTKLCLGTFRGKTP